MKRSLNKIKSTSKTILAIALAFSLSFCALPTSIAQAEVRRSDVVVFDTVENRGLSTSQCPDVGCASALLKNDSGKTFFSRDSEKSVKIASLTKLATAYVAMQNASLETKVVVTNKAVAAGGSSAGFSVGDTMSLSDALLGLMIPSGNDAAVAIAESVGKQLANTQDDTAAYDAFVAKMNEAATSLGCTNTLYTNPHGLDADEFASDAHSCASDVMRFIEANMKNDTFREIVKKDTANIKVTNDSGAREVTVNTTDPLLGNYEGACGIKTGTTDEAGYCFAGAVEKDGEVLYSVVLGGDSDSSRFSDTQNMWNWVLDNMVDYKFCNAEGNTMAKVSLSDRLDSTVDASINDTEESEKLFKFAGNVSQTFEFSNLSGEIAQGQKVGTVSFWQNNTLIKTLDLVSTQTIEAPSILENIKTAFIRFSHIFTKEADSASTQILNDTPLLLEYS